MLTLSIIDEGITLPLRALPSRGILEEQNPVRSFLHVNVVSWKRKRENNDLKL